MKKKGFTIIEIIVALALITIIGTGSFVGVRYASENIRINKLSQITDKAIQAAQVYIESNKEASNQLYNKQNGVVLPIKFLVKEGLLDLSYTDIKEQDYKDEYVITALSTNSENSADCVDINSKASWDKDKVIFICLNSKTEITNTIKEVINNYIYGSDQSNSSENNSQSDNIFDEMFDLYNINNNYLAKGNNPNNYVKINFNNNSSIWRVVNVIDGTIELINWTPELVMYPASSNSYLKFNMCGTTTECNNGVSCYTNKNDIPFKNYINTNYILNTQYVLEINHDYGHKGIDYSQNIPYQSYIGIITYSDILNASSTDGNWLMGSHLNNSENYISIGYKDTNGGCNPYELFVSSSNDYIDHDNRKKVLINPVIKLSTCNKLIKNEEKSCTGSNGSVTCPYILDSSKCN